MRHQPAYKIPFSLLLLFCFISLVACSKKNYLEQIIRNKIDLSNPPLEITILDTGKSDCILIKIKDKTIMIDTGLDENGDQILNTLFENEITEIDFMILTHLDKDHIGGANIILDNIKVNQVIQANYSKDTKQYEEYIKALEENNITPTLLQENLDLNINGATITLYPASKSEYEKSNNHSIITSLNYKKQNFLFTGDAEGERISEFLTLNPSNYTFIKLPHHGQYSDELAALVTKITPSYGVITCSEEQAPDIATIVLLNENNVQTLLSSDGTIVIKSDGENINFSQHLTQSAVLQTKIPSYY